MHWWLKWFLYNKIITNCNFIRFSVLGNFTIKITPVVEGTWPFTNRDVGPVFAVWIDFWLETFFQHLASNNQKFIRGTHFDLRPYSGRIKIGKLLLIYKTGHVHEIGLSPFSFKIFMTILNNLNLNVNDQNNFSG